MDFTRRDFVRSVAVAGAGAVAANRVFAQGTGGKKELNVAIIGTGTQGREALIQGGLALEGIRFKAVCDMWEFSSRYASRRLAAIYKDKYGPDSVATYKDYQDMLAKEKDLDAVIVATPDFMHAEHSIACMEAGLHVYCEKEMSNTLDSAKKMVEASKKTGKLLQIGHQRRSNPIYKHTLTLLAEHNLCGRLTTCYGQWNRGVQDLYKWHPRYEITSAELKKYGYENMEQFRNWRWYRKYSAGPIADLGSHQIDIFSWFLHADPSQVMALGGSDYFPDREWYEDVTCLYQYPYTYKEEKGTARAYYQVLNTNSFGHYFERFSGDGGALTISEQSSKCYFVPEPGKSVPDFAADIEPVQVETCEPGKPGGNRAYPLLPMIEKLGAEAAADIERYRGAVVPHQFHLENFFDAVRAGKKEMLTCDGEEAYKTAVAVLNVIPAIEKGGGLQFSAPDFEA